MRVEYHDIPSVHFGSVEAAVLVPPAYDASQTNPLLIDLHGGGANRDTMVDMAPMYEDSFKNGALPPNLVCVSFSDQ